MNTSQCSFIWNSNVLIRENTIEKFSLKNVAILLKILFVRHQACNE